MRIFVLPLLLLCSAAHANTLVVVNKGDNDVSLIDAQTGVTRARVPVQEGPHEVAISPDGLRALVTNYGRSQPGASVSLLDIARAQVVATHSIAPHAWPHGIAWTGQTAWITTEDDRSHGSLIAVDPVDGTMTQSIPTGQALSHMLALHPDGRRAFVTNIASDSVSVLDRSTGTLEMLVGTKRAPEGLAVSPDGRELWVASQDSARIQVFDTETLQLKEEFPAANRPIRIAFTPDGRRALVVCARSMDLLVFDTATRGQVARVQFDHEGAKGWSYGNVPSVGAVIASSDSQRAYVSLVSARRVAEVDLASFEILRLIPTGRQPDGLGWSPVTLPQP